MWSLPVFLGTREKTNPEFPSHVFACWLTIRMSTSSCSSLCATPPPRRVKSSLPPWSKIYPGPGEGSATRCQTSWRHHWILSGNITWMSQLFLWILLGLIFRFMQYFFMTVLDIWFILKLSLLPGHFKSKFLTTNRDLLCHITVEAHSTPWLGWSRDMLLLRRQNSLKSMGSFAYKKEKGPHLETYSRYSLPFSQCRAADWQCRILHLP